MRYWVIFLLTLSITISQDEGYIDSTMIRNPKIAWKLGLVPGMGQLYNGKPFKALGFFAGEYLVISRFNKFKNANRIGLRNSYAWLIFGLYVWNILDAYVDAQLTTFPVKRIESNIVKDSLKVQTK